MTGSPSVLLVEPDPAVRDAVTTLLRRRGYAVTCARTAADAEARIRAAAPDLLVTELLLPGGSGFRLAELAKAVSDGRTPVVMLSALAAAAHRDYALMAGADAFLAKPFRASALTAAAAELCPAARPAAVRFAAAV